MSTAAWNGEAQLQNCRHDGRAAEFAKRKKNFDIQKRVGTTVARGGNMCRQESVAPSGATVRSHMETAQWKRATWNHISPIHVRDKDADLLAGEAPTPSATTTTPAAILRATQRFATHATLCHSCRKVTSDEIITFTTLYLEANVRFSAGAPAKQTTYNLCNQSEQKTVTERIALNRRCIIFALKLSAGQSLSISLLVLLLYSFFGSS